MTYSGWTNKEIAEGGCGAVPSAWSWFCWTENGILQKQVRVFCTQSHEGDNVPAGASLLTGQVLTSVIWAHETYRKHCCFVFHLPNTFSSEQLKHLHLQLITYPEYENFYSFGIYHGIGGNKPKVKIEEPYFKNNTMKIYGKVKCSYMHSKSTH